MTIKDEKVSLPDMEKFFFTQIIKNLNVCFYIAFSFTNKHAQIVCDKKKCIIYF